jgi:hypothetical protein
VPVRGGVIEVPDFDPARYHDSDSCQLALNAALGQLSDQMRRIPFPPPGEPGYHEWANGIGEQMNRLNAMRPTCLALGARGRTATVPQARRFATRSRSFATRFTGLAAQIRTTRALAKRHALADRFLGAATVIASRFDLEALKRRKSFLRGGIGTSLGRGRLVKLPGFANAIQNIADYDADLVEMTEKRAAVDPQLAEEMQIDANFHHGKPYEQLTLDERREVARRLQARSGALDNLLQRGRKAGAAGARHNFGR